MWEFLQRLLDTAAFMPRWVCGTWTPLEGWLHIIADLGIWLAYLAIPCVLLYFVRKRREIPFRTVFVLFGAFILACGTTHLMDVVVFWWPAYRVAIVIKLLTAIVSLATVAALFRVAPELISLRTPAELEEQIVVRIKVEEDLRAAQEKMQSALREKESMLKEIHHRVKNNLTVISSLFYLQSVHATDGPTIQILQESQDRIRSMALVHETLYGQGTFSGVAFGEYVQALAAQLIRTYTLPSQSIVLKCEIDDLHMDADAAVPCGLILNELISNSLKHAFPAGSNGQIVVGLKLTGNACHVLMVKDNGSKEIDPARFEQGSSLGLRLVRSLARQMNGSFEIRAAHPGTEARLTFSPSHADE